MRTACLLFAITFSLRGDFADGMRAYQAQDYATAIKAWRPYADQGVAQAQYNIGLMYALGQGVQKDPAQAASWYEKAAQQGWEQAEFNLGIIYLNSSDTGDYSKAEQWLKKAAEAGDKNAELALGDLYNDKLHQYPNARQWYEKAAADRNAKAEFALGLIYDQGRGVTADPAQAADWYRKAADQAYGPALTNLGILYYGGEGVPHDVVLAREYFLLGEKGNDPRAFGLAQWTDNKLTPDEVRRASQMADQWASEHGMKLVSQTH